MGLFKNSRGVALTNRHPYIPAGVHILSEPVFKAAMNRDGKVQRCTVEFKVLASDATDPAETLKVGSTTSFYVDNKHENDLYVRKVKGVVLACAESALCEDPSQTISVETDEIGEEELLEACYGPFVYGDDDKPVDGGKDAKVGERNADADLEDCFGFYPKLVEGAERGTSYAAAVVRCEAYKPSGKKYVVCTFTGLPRDYEVDAE